MLCGSYVRGSVRGAENLPCNRFILTIFDVQKVLGLKPTRSSALLREIAEHGIIEPVSGHGKGKYRFRQQ